MSDLTEQRKAVADAMTKQAQKKKPQVLRGINAEPVPNKRPAITHDPKKPIPSFVRG